MSRRIENKADIQAAIQAVNELLDQTDLVKKTRRHLECVLLDWLSAEDWSQTHRENVVFYFRMIFDFIDSIDDIVNKD